MKVPIIMHDPCSLSTDFTEIGLSLNTPSFIFAVTAYILLHEYFLSVSLSSCLLFSSYVARRLNFDFFHYLSRAFSTSELSIFLVRPASLPRSLFPP